MSRKDFNTEILKHLENKKFFEKFVPSEIAADMYETLDESIQDNPDHRFGQLMCLYVYPDYKHRSNSSLNMIMDMMFYNVQEPFNEESSTTFNRLVIWYWCH